MSKNVLEDIINRYKKELTNTPQYNPELEIRYKNIDYSNFSIIYTYLLENVDKKDITVSQMVSCLMKQKNGPDQLQTINIKNIYFKGGKSFKQEYSSKIPLLIPYYDTNKFGLSYSVVLSLEKNDILPFISDENAIIRVKNRISFKLIDNDIEWRVDATVIRQITGSNASTSLEKIVNQMFKNTEITPYNILKIFNEDKISQRIYKYEIEIELINNENITSKDVINIATKLLYIANPNYLSEITLQSKIYDIAKYIIKSPGFLQQFQNKLGLKQLLPKVQTLTRYDYRNIYPMQGYYVTDKADGVRAVGICEDGVGYIISDSLQIFNNKSDIINKTIVDAELVDDVLYVFDIIVINNQDVSQLTFENRLPLLSVATDILNKAGIKAKTKVYNYITDSLEKSIKDIYFAEHPYEIDGLIFVKPGDIYINTKTYKWKKLEDNTIDFLVKTVPKSILGQKMFIPKSNHTLYFLFVGISSDLFNSLRLHRCPGYNDIFDDTKFTSSSNYFPIQFCPSNAPYAYIYYHPDNSILEINNNIVEFRCISNCVAENGPIIGWQPVRIRKDRQKDLESKTYYGNDYKIAEIAWINYMDPFPLEQLWLNISTDYFASNKLGMYHSQTSVISFLKTNRIMSYSHQNWVIDIGSGKGQDLGRYFSAKIKNLIAIDNDKASLSELVRRKFTFAQDKTKNNISTNVYVVLADMKSEYTNVLDKLSSISVNPGIIDVIICNLSVHYYIYTTELLTNFIKLVNNLLKTNGQLVITCFFGENIFSLLKKLNEGDTWTVYEGDIIKYSIRKMYSSTSLENSGQKIGVILPFSNGEYYEEYIINTKYLIKEFEKYNIILINKTNLKNVITDFKLKNPSSASLTNDDIQYLSLYGELVFQKK
jgi:hypothetical protein